MIRSFPSAEPALDLLPAAEVRALAVDELRRAGLAVRRLLGALEPHPAAVGAGHDAVLTMFSVLDDFGCRKRPGAPSVSARHHSVGARAFVRRPLAAWDCLAAARLLALDGFELADPAVRIHRRQRPDPVTPGVITQ